MANSAYSINFCLFVFDVHLATYVTAQPSCKSKKAQNIPGLQLREFLFVSLWIILTSTSRKYFLLKRSADQWDNQQQPLVVLRNKRYRLCTSWKALRTSSSLISRKLLSYRRFYDNDSCKLLHTSTGLCVSKLDDMVVFGAFFVVCVRE